MQREAGRLTLKPRPFSFQTLREPLGLVQLRAHGRLRCALDTPPVGEQALPSVRSPYLGAPRESQQREQIRQLATAHDDYPCTGLCDQLVECGCHLRIRTRTFGALVEWRQSAVVIQHQYAVPRVAEAFEKGLKVYGGVERLHRDQGKAPPRSGPAGRAVKQPPPSLS